MNENAPTRRIRWLVTILVALLGFGAGFAFRGSHVAPRPEAKPVRAKASMRTRSSNAHQAVAARFAPAKPTRAEVVAYLERTYRQEQIARELDLEQRRY